MKDSLTLQNGAVLYTAHNENPSFAPFMLGYFSALKGDRRVLELCSGNGSCSIWLWDRGLRGETLLVDMRNEPLQLAQRSAEENGFAGIRVLQADAAEYRDERLFDAVLCNPPFFDDRDVSADENRAAYRHENGFTLPKLCATARLNLKQRGRLVLCHMPQRLPEIFAAMQQNDIEPKRLCFCRHSAGKAPFLVLVEGRYKAGRGLEVLPDIIVKNADGSYTAEMLEICESGYE